MKSSLSNTFNYRHYVNITVTNRGVSDNVNNTVASTLSVVMTTKTIFLKILLNIQFGDETWQQSTLPVSLGGLGVRSVTASADFISAVAFFSSTSRYRSSSYQCAVSVDESLTCARSLSTFQQFTEIMGLATTEVQISQRDVSCTISSRSSPASCGCTTSFWRFFDRR